jgi:hypothetical protein
MKAYTTLLPDGSYRAVSLSPFVIVHGRSSGDALAKLRDARRHCTDQRRAPLKYHLGYLYTWLFFRRR